MARTELDVLLDKVDDVALRTELKSQIERLNAKRMFGLVFESHLPERLRLLEHPIRRGVKVTHRDAADGPTFEILGVEGDTATMRKVRNPDGTSLSPEEAAGVVDETAAVQSLVVITDFGEPIYPGLRHLGSIDKGGDKPAHVVIKGENHHVLEMLQFTHAGKIDCIYIDPPYNTGAKDWKYNNDYVEGEDLYRHSKWLAMMERRLNIARQLLNPDDSVLIVTIDEREGNRLGLLLDQLFPEARIQMVSSLTNPKGVSANGGFRRADEYIFFVMIGSATPARMELKPEWSPSPKQAAKGVPESNEVREVEPAWTSMMRRGSNSARSDRPKMFYPIYADPETRTIREIGTPLPAGTSDAPERAGLVPILPLRRNGKEGRWQVGPQELEQRIEQGRVRLGRPTPYGYVVNYLPDGAYADVLAGKFQVTGRASDGSLIAQGASDERIAPSQWKIESHNASEHGSTLIEKFIPQRAFPFPKSLYAVEDTLRFFVMQKPSAVVLDFFAGSGTTAHAVMRLNKQLGGQRQCISVTNNEVGPDEQSSLREDGLRPGDADWERLGIYDYITRPRVEAAITGSTPEGDPISGEYRFTDPFPMAEGFEENAEFFELTYLDPDDVELDLAFSSVAPLLWLRAGGQGPLVADRRTQDGGLKPWDTTDRYGVLFNPDHWRSFVKKLPSSARTAFVITDSQTTFTGVAAELPGSLDVVRLYENYMTTFTINQGR